MWNWHIDAISEHLEAVTRGEIRNLLINIPPRYGKSTLICVMWPSWEWVTSPNLRYLFASYSESLALRDNVRARWLIMSEWYQQNWGDVFRFAGDMNQQTKVANDKTGYRMAFGSGGSVTGEGGARLVIDDAHNMKDVDSPGQTAKIVAWHDNVWYNRTNNPAKVARVYVMQRGRADDLSGHLLERGGIEHLCLPQEYEGRTMVTSLGWKDPRTEDGQLLWPARMSEEHTADLKRTLGSFAYAAQYQQRPAPAAGGVWKRDWLRFYRQSELPRFFDEVITSWDCTFKDTKNSDYVCGHKIGRVGADYYLIDQRWAKMEFPATLKAIEEFNDEHRWLINATLVEDKANGPAVISALRSKISGLIPITPEGGKEARAAAVAPLFEAGNIYLPMEEELPWVGEMIVEWVTFPAAPHDDRVDAFSQGLVWMRKNCVGMIQAMSVPRDEPRDDNTEFERPSPWRNF